MGLVTVILIMIKPRIQLQIETHLTNVRYNDVYF